MVYNTRTVYYTRIDYYARTELAHPFMQCLIPNLNACAFSLSKQSATHVLPFAAHTQPLYLCLFTEQASDQTDVRTLILGTRQ